MYRSLLLLALSFFLPFFSSGAEILWSKELPENGRFPYLKILGAFDDGYYVLRSNIEFSDENLAANRMRRFLLTAYSTGLDQRWETEIIPSIPDSRILEVHVVGGKVLVLSYCVRSDGSGYDVHAQYIGKDGRMSGIPVPIESFPETRFDNERRPGLAFSKDRSKIALTYRKTASDDTSQTLCAIVLDTALQRIYRKEWTMDAPIRRFSPTHFLLTNEGGFFLLGVIYLTDKRVKEPGESYFLLSGYDPGAEKVINRDIRLENKFLTNVSAAVDAQNRRIVVAGFYSELGMLASAGVFYYGLDQDSLTETEVYWAPFTQDLLTKAITDRGDPKKKELFNYYVDRLILRKDGGAAIVAESYVETTRTFWDYYTQSAITHTYYRYGNIILASVNPSGGMLWNRLLQKEQNSTDDGGYESSYCSLVSGGKVYTIFNKYIDRRSSVMIAAVDGTGALQTDVLFPESERISVIARAARQVDEQTLLIPAIRQGDYRIAKITFD
ncbi:MAG: hypothetical protein RL213_1368 [Bacteroidota bacterium]